MNPDQILKQLEPLADPEYRESTAHFAPQVPSETGGVWTTIGVRAKELREFEKPLFATLKTEADFLDALKFCDEAFKRRHRELAVIGIEALLKLKRHWHADMLNHICRWIPEISDWGMCDILGGLVGRMIISGVITTNDIASFKNHPSIWGQRFLIVSLVLPLRKGFGDADRHLRILSHYNGRREKMITKAVSWALREGTKSHPDKIRVFIDKYADNLHGPILREVKNKLDKGVKR